MPVLTLDELREHARQRLPGPVWDFIEGGSGDEHTLRAGEAAYRELCLRPRVLVDVAAPDCALELLGTPLASPFGVAPMAYHRLVHPQGETATAEGAARAGALLVVGMFASRPLEDIASAGGPRWLQVYWLRRRDALAGLVDRAEAAGFGALMLTVDAPQVARRRRDVRNAFALPADVTAVNLNPGLTERTHRATAGSSGIEAHAREQFDPTLTWDDLSWLRERTRLPLVLKGVLTAEDARIAVECGVDALVVSNHGGRQLDRAVPALQALPEVVASVPESCPVLIDGGVRSGVDAAIALALGARAVLVGRPVLWGLAHAGAEGVGQVLGLLRSELLETMALSGCPRLAGLGPTAVSRRPPLRDHPWPPSHGEPSHTASTTSGGFR
ncbi:alpha-hydroxy acid oxidase [Streptomyces sp. MUM 16J]|uniref:alpha-hydroxy acid oxidase n=1 Tax=Streptomyces sp. MUM 16J TaxID=2791988 RepID=UPI001F03D099|nr:alpha-hydroxy acid oxidase [Streptomyces sp. MUM 16J]MCH0559330.1 alpha-hydroxy-acid oxidizing protein [Streptomyces sp. MUM 16J]